MAKKSKTTEPQSKSGAPRWIFHLIATLLLIGGGVVGFHYFRQQVEKSFLVSNEPPKIVLVNRPIWMTDARAEQIMKLAHVKGKWSALDDRVLPEIARAMEKSAWVSKVRQVRRTFGEKPGDTIEIDCEYRTPAALVAWGGYFWLIDTTGVKLPNCYNAAQLTQVMFAQNMTHPELRFRLIEGVNAAPPEEGRRWAGEDVIAGLDLVKQLSDKTWANEIWCVDVANFGGRKNPSQAQLTLITDKRTRVLWGEPVHSAFFSELNPAKKLANLEQVKKDYGRVDANQQWIDVRMDKITVPLDVVPPHGTGLEARTH